jgi:hypothetical protein
VTLTDDLIRGGAAFIDTAPFIYYIEAHPQFGPTATEVIDAVVLGKVKAFSSVVTFVEVLPKPIQVGNEKLVPPWRDRVF